MTSRGKSGLHGGEASEEELMLLAEGKMRLPKAEIQISDLLMIATGKVEGSQAVQALLDERER